MKQPGTSTENFAASINDLPSRRNLLSAKHSKSSKPEGLNRKVPRASKAASESSVERASGVGSLQGRQRSKLNATKHGIFSKPVVLEGESRTEYESLWNGLRESCQPEGRLEEVLVEKLAVNLWRHRRLILAEASEIRKNVQFTRWDADNAQYEEAEKIASQSEEFSERGLICKISNPAILARCLELLIELRDRFESNGFQLKQDYLILVRIYGEVGQRHLYETLADIYSGWQMTSMCPEDERLREGCASPIDCHNNVLKAIEDEIRRLKQFQKSSTAIQAERIRLDTLRRNIPKGPALDRLLRYETSLERAFDRALSQLERLQRMRLGQPVAPTLKVELSG